MRGESQLVTTGCLSCRARSVKCDNTNPWCKHYSSSQWHTNQALARHAHPNSASKRGFAILNLDLAPTGTARERQSLHFFTIITSQELSGYFDSAFWRQGLLQTSIHDAAIRHAVAAIGALHEHILRRQALRDNSETTGFQPFALRQCNKAIKHLLQRSNGRDGANLVPAMTAAVLFAYIENMQGDRDAAVPHVLYAGRLAEQHKDARSLSGRAAVKAYPLEIGDLEPLLSHLEIQLGDSPGDNLPHGQGRELDIFASLHFECLAGARISLEKAIAQMSTVVLTLRGPPDSETIELAARAKAPYVDWLHRWESAFSDLLSRQAQHLDQSVLSGCRVLKAHQVAGSILAAVDYTLGNQAWEPFTPQFKIIVNLCTAVVADLPSRLTSRVPQKAYLSLGMGITEPLYATATRCADASIAAKARVLLHRLPQNEGAFSEWRISSIEALLKIATCPPHSG